MVIRFAFLLAALVLAAPLAAAQGTPLTLASTTSTENSGLLGEILPRFTKDTGIAVRVVAVGTGAALNLGRSGDADILLVHAREDEDAFVAAGYGAFRRDVMFNDFVIVGPRQDPAGIGAQKDAASAFATIAMREGLFVSRADNSGTHKAEMRIWRSAGVDPVSASGRWYKESGSGMGATLNLSAGLNAYTLSDRGTWLSFRNQGDLTIVFEGDPPLKNPYGVILVNPARHPHIQAKNALTFIDWLTGPRGQAAIDSFRISGQQLFFPIAKQPQR